MDGIVLLAKKPGLTSFSSLFSVKKALETSKVGHTGTLDSFAQGLLVVCIGRYTRLASNITEFDKSYKAVISFGKETDTLEYTGKTVKTSDLPDLEELKSVIKSFEGKQFQAPPLFSAIHVNGQRASDAARKGKEIEIPKREITVYKANLCDVLLENSKVKSCLVEFEVSKGTYIRSLARDIACKCGSTGYLTGLFRTRVGNFSVEQAAGYSQLKEFSINNCLEQEQNYLNTVANEPKSEKKAFIETPEEIQIKKEIAHNIMPLNIQTAKMCGFYPITIKKNSQEDFLHGRPLKKNMFVEFIDSLKNESILCVFNEEEKFLGLLDWKDENRLAYKFVNN